MNVVVTLEHRFLRSPDGAVWTQAAFAYRFWTRYLGVFEKVRPVARLLDVAEVPPDWVRSDGPHVEFCGVPHYLGPMQYLSKAAAAKRAVRAALASRDAVILRVPSRLASIAHHVMVAENRPYGLEVVGDPHDVFAKDAVRHPLRPFFRWMFARELRAQCLDAAACAYVTAFTIQQRYPPAANAFVTHYSDVELPDAAFVDGPGEVRHSGPFTVVYVGSLAQMYKGPDVLVDAAADCIASGLDLKLVLVGEGRYRPDLERRARALGVVGRVEFTGQLTAGSPVREALDRADLFVLPSRTEGLPRALIEAMARGLPCIGSNVGGIPELLPAEDMVASGDVHALAALIEAVLSDPARRQRMGSRNLTVARTYHDDALLVKRATFYKALQECSAAWQENVQ